MIKQQYILDYQDSKPELRAEIYKLSSDFEIGQNSFQTISAETLEKWDHNELKCYGNVDYPEIEKEMKRREIEEFIFLFHW